MGFFRISDSGSQTHIFFESLVTIFWVKSSIILWKLAQIFFCSISKTKIIYNFVKFVDTKKSLTNKIFSPLSLVTVFGSGIRDPGSEIRDPHTPPRLKAVCRWVSAPIVRPPWLPSTASSNLQVNDRGEKFARLGGCRVEGSSCSLRLVSLQPTATSPLIPTYSSG